MDRSRESADKDPSIAAALEFTPVEVFMDADLFRFDRIWAAAGSPYAVFAIEPATLRDAIGAPVMELEAG